MYEVVGWAIDELDEARPRHLLGIGDVDDLIRGVELGIDTFDCAMPTRLGRHGMARRARAGEPAGAWTWPRPAGRSPRSRSWKAARAPPAPPATPAATCTTWSSPREPTGPRLLTLHNLAYVPRLMADLREAVAAGALAEHAAALRAGAAP